MKRVNLFLLLVPALFVVCTSQPTTVAEEEPLPDPVVEEPAPTTVAISQEVYDATLAEVQRFIGNLNRTISSRNFSQWREALTDTYFEHVSSREFLAQASETPALKTAKIVLRSANDDFTNVVVPSRANSKVDEIEFVDNNTVRAYYLETRSVRVENEVVTETRRLRLYELVKVDNNWKISN
jgi:hypothetical protein